MVEKEGRLIINFKKEFFFINSMKLHISNIFSSYDEILNNIFKKCIHEHDFSVTQCYKQR